MDQDFRSRLKALVDQAMELQGLPGFAVGVVRADQLVYAEGFGVADLGSKVPVTPETVFHTASLSKTFVATAILQLAESQTISLDEPIVSYLPYFRMESPLASGITARQLLSHTSGIPDIEDYGWDKPERDSQALERGVRKLESVELRSPPGERYSYSNPGFNLLGDLIAKASRMSFEDYMKERIFGPLAMGASAFSPERPEGVVLAAPHVFTSDGQVAKSEIYPYHRAQAPSGTLTSSIRDLSQWLRVSLRRGRLGKNPGTRILADSRYEMMWRPVMTTGGNDGSQIALGWFVRQYRGRLVISHSGWDLGFRASMCLVPEEDLGIVTLSNFHWTHLGLLNRACLDLALGETPDPLALASVDQTQLAGVYAEARGETLEVIYEHEALSVVRGQERARLVPQGRFVFGGWIGDQQELTLRVDPLQMERSASVSLDGREFRRVKDNYI